MGSREGAPQAFASQERRGAVRCALVLASCSLVVAVAALALVLVKEQQTPMPELTRRQARNSSRMSPPREPPNSAQLILNPNGTSHIKMRKLAWFSGTSTKGAYLGSAFEYNNSDLLVKVPGQYCIYAQMKVRRYDKISRKEVDASLTVYCKSAVSPEPRGLLTVQLKLSPNSNETVQGFKVVSHLLASNDTLYVNITASPNVERDWILTEHGNFFGLFQIFDS